MKKDWISRELTIEVIVGAFMVMIFFGLGYFTIILSKTALFAKKIQMEIVFGDVMGLRDGDGVVVRGMTVGKVQNLILKEDGVHVIAAIDEGKPVRMRDDYRITIVSTSILGGRYLDVYEGLKGHEIEMSSIFRGQEPYDLMADAAALVNAARKTAVEGGMIENFKTVSEDLKSISQRLHDGKGSLGKLLSEDDTLYNDLSATAASLRDITARIESGQGFLGRLMKDDGLYEDLRNMIDEARATIDDFRETAPVTTFTSVFFGAF